MKQTLYENCIENERFELLTEWDAVKNVPLMPWTVSPGSNRRVWWRCRKGHEWKTTVADRAAGGGCPVCGSRKLLTGFNDLATMNPMLAAEWHPDKNGELTPDQVFPGSNMRVWWQCEKGHEWQAVIASRAKAGCSCPYCARKKLLTGYNDLKTLVPELAAQWHPTDNGNLTPEQVQPYSSRVVWWQCSKGHAWKASISHRMKTKEKNGCPICANRKILVGVNDLASQYPELAAQWHPTKNGDMTPQSVGAGSHSRVWWRCEKGHEWRAKIVSRTDGGCGCPACKGGLVIPGENDLATIAPALAAQWHPSKNNDLMPQQVRAQSNRQVWWRCEKGHEWKTSVNARMQNGSGCPYCSNKKVLAGFNDLATLEPKIAAQWDPELNGALTPQMVSRGSKKKIWWKCADGHVWRAAIFSRTGPQKCGCPVCAGVVSEKRRNQMKLLEAEARSLQPQEPVRVRYPVEGAPHSMQTVRESVIR